MQNLRVRKLPTSTNNEKEYAVRAEHAEVYDQVKDM